MTFIVPWRFLRQQRRNSVYRYLDEDSESGCRIYTLPTSLRPLAGRSNRIYIPGICSIYYGQVSTRHCQAHWHRFYCHALYERSLATDPASTADKTSLVPDLYTIQFVVRFGDMDTSAGRSTEARGLPYAFPAYDPRDTLTLSETQKLSTGPAFPVFGTSSP